MLADLTAHIFGLDVRGDKTKEFRKTLASMVVPCYFWAIFIRPV